MRLTIATSALALALAGCGANLGPPPLRGERVSLNRALPRTFGLEVPLRAAAPQFTVIHTFEGPRTQPGGTDGANPYAGLIADDRGNLYGTTFAGGSANAGTVFKLMPSRDGFKESILHSFKGGSDGAGPYASLLEDKKGALYGTTSLGGVFGYGTVFKLTPLGHGYSNTILHHFRGGNNDGQTPESNLIVDEAGALYGTTYAGGVSCECGTVYKLTPAGSRYSEIILHAFQNYTDGANPIAGVISDETGALYGTTQYGGDDNYPSYGASFKMTPSAKSDYTVSIIADFTYGFGYYGSTPFGGLIANAKGTLYGTTVSGGSACGTPGCGTVFALTPSGSGYSESVLYNFQNSPDGAYPTDSLVKDEAGSLYGTTQGGGSAACAYGCGTVFELTPYGGAYADTILHAFQGGDDGKFPFAGLIRVNGAFYGTAYQGGKHGFGTVFKVVP